jgi:hypothetical protein
MSLSEGDALTLVPEPDNEYDAQALKVFRGGKAIGYVPNRGRTCPECLGSVSSRSELCEDCEVLPESGGLAYRIQKLGILQKDTTIIVVRSIKADTKTPVHVDVIYATE